MRVNIGANVTGNEEREVREIRVGDLINRYDTDGKTSYCFHFSSDKEYYWACSQLPPRLSKQVDKNYLWRSVDIPWEVANRDPWFKIIEEAFYERRVEVFQLTQGKTRTRFSIYILPEEELENGPYPTGE